MPLVSRRSLKKPPCLAASGEAVPAGGDLAQEKPLSKKERKRQAKLLREQQKLQKQEALRMKAAAASAASTSTSTSTHKAAHATPPLLAWPFSTSSLRTVSSAAAPAVTVPPPPQPSMPSTTFPWPAPASLNPNYFAMAASAFTMPTRVFDQQNALQPLQVPSSLSMLSAPISATPVCPPRLLPVASAYYPTLSSVLPTTTPPVPTATETAAAARLEASVCPPPCPVLPAAAALANAHYYCRYCSCGATAPSDWVAHWNSGAHQFNVMCARDRLWNYRQPNWSLAIDDTNFAPHLCVRALRKGRCAVCTAVDPLITRSIYLDHCI